MNLKSWRDWKANLKQIKCFAMRTHSIPYYIPDWSAVHFQYSEVHTLVHCTATSLEVHCALLEVHCTSLQVYCTSHKVWCTGYTLVWLIFCLLGNVLQMHCMCTSMCTSPAVRLICISAYHYHQHLTPTSQYSVLVMCTACTLLYTSVAV